VPAKPVDLASVAYTLQVGREAMEERMGFIVNSIDQLAEKLSAYISGEKNIDGVCQGRVESRGERTTIIDRDDDIREAIDRWITHSELLKLLEVWVKGLSFDWNKLYGSVKPQRVSLPAYPFARQRCWIPDMVSGNGQDHKSEADIGVKSIEDIVNQIDDDLIETELAIQELRSISASLYRPPASLTYSSRSKTLLSGKSNGHRPELKTLV
jgi:acyl transferase domain-containing protein